MAECTLPVSNAMLREAVTAELERRRREQEFLSAYASAVGNIVTALESLVSALEAEPQRPETLAELMESAIQSDEPEEGDHIADVAKMVEPERVDPEPDDQLEARAPIYQGKTTPARLTDLDPEVAQELRRIQPRLQRWVLEQWSIDWESFLEHTQGTARKRMIVGRWLVYYCGFYPKEAGALLSASAMNVGSWSGQFSKRATIGESKELDQLVADLAEFCEYKGIKNGQS